MLRRRCSDLVVDQDCWGIGGQHAFSTNGDEPFRGSPFSCSRDSCCWSKAKNDGAARRAVHSVSEGRLQDAFSGNSRRTGAVGSSVGSWYGSRYAARIRSISAKFHRSYRRSRRTHDG